MPKLYIGNREVTPAIAKGSSINNQDKTITENGIYTADAGYTGLGEVTVNVSGGSLTGITREVSSTGVYQMPKENFTFSLPSNATNVGAYAMQRAFYYCTGITSADLSSLTIISGEEALDNAFSSCSNIVNVDLSNLTTVSGYSSMNNAFYYCQNLATLNLSNLTTVTNTYAMQAAFSSCSSLTSVDLSSLTTISGSNTMSGTFISNTQLTTVDLSSLTTIDGFSAARSIFQDCPNLTSVDLSSLSTVTGAYAMGSAFYNCNSLKTLSFPSLTSTGVGSNNGQFWYMLYGVTGCTVHFPSNLEEVIGSWSDVTAGFGGTNTTVLFDLPKTEGHITPV